MIVYTGHSPKYIAIAAPERSECVPTSSTLMPKISSPIDDTAARRAWTISLEVIWSMRLNLQTAETGVSDVAPGYPRILRTMAAHRRTGHSRASPDLSWVTVSMRSSFFCHSKVIETLSENSICEWLWVNSMPLRKKRMFRKRRTAVRRFSAWGTFRYSHDLQAKKNDAIDNWLMAC